MMQMHAASTSSESACEPSARSMTLARGAAAMRGRGSSVDGGRACGRLIALSTPLHSAQPASSHTVTPWETPPFLFVGTSRNAAVVSAERADAFELASQRTPREAGAPPRRTEQEGSSSRAGPVESARKRASAVAVNPAITSVQSAACVCPASAPLFPAAELRASKRGR